MTQTEVPEYLIRKGGAYYRPKWKDEPPTAIFIANLRAALAAARVPEGGE